MCWFIQKHTVWDPSRLSVFATHLSIMSRALTALGIEVHLGTEWAIKWAPAGVLVAMLERARRCSTQLRLAWLPWKPILLKRIFVMEGIWICERLLMTLLWQSQTDGAAGRRKHGKGGKEPRRKWERACGRGKQCRRYERQRRSKMRNREKCFAFTLNDPSAEVCCGCGEGVCFALGMSSSSKYKLTAGFTFSWW